ncbi:MAG: hypothetical protein Q8R92_02030 [Deltaproteobacteria bacterium]|nr:hypothetical protein [Deltaproteobacteria bacterium]
MHSIAGHLRIPVIALALTLLIVSAAAPLALAQSGGSSPRMPGVFQPEVGAGTVYEMSSAQAPKSAMTYAIVGKEAFEGKEAWWIELRFDLGEEGEMIMKQLAFIPPEGVPEPKRMIMQAGESPPMEFPPEMVASIGRRARTEMDKAGLGEKVGTESITVPAGTFRCDHYRQTTGDWTGEVWVSRDVRPNGMVKMVSPEGSMTLVKVLSNETSRIKGAPQRMPAMPGGFPGGAPPMEPPAPRAGGTE